MSPRRRVVVTPASCVRFVRDHSPLVIVRARRRRRLQRTRRDTTPQGHWAAAPDPEPISPTRSHSCLPACPCWFEVVHGGRAARPPPLAALLHARSHTRAPSRIPSRAGMASHQGFPRHDSYRRRCVRALLPRPRLRVRRKLTTELAAHATTKVRTTLRPYTLGEL